MTLLSAADIAQIKSDINSIVTDTSINTTITYRQLSGTSYYYSPKTQLYEPPYIDWSGVSALKGTKSYRDSVRFAGVDIGNVKFVFMTSSVSGTLGTGKMGDLVIEGGTTYTVKLIEVDPLSVAYVVYAESV